ncbi:MAG: DIP1984 family protein [Finegoldia sp.]|nr:DIP1984 family protein [Finegoldia sp.]
MKLAEALQEIKDLQNKVEALRERLTLNAVYQEGVESPEDPRDLKVELDEVIDELEILTFRINDTNAKTETEKGSLTRLIARRDALILKRSVYSSLRQASSDIVPRYGAKEIRVYSNFDLKELNKEIDLISKELRQVENLIQMTNWTVDLI